MLIFPFFVGSCMSGLVTTLDAGPARLKISIPPDAVLPQALSELRSVLIRTMRELGHDDAVPESIDVDETGSLLLLKPTASGIDILRLLGMVTELQQAVQQLQPARIFRSRAPLQDGDEQLQAWYPDLWLHQDEISGGELTRALLDHGIRSDADFLKHHQKVPVNLRLEAAEARFKAAFAGAGMDKSARRIKPSVLVDGLPPWLNTSIREMATTIPALGVLADSGLDDIRDIARLDDPASRQALDIDDERLRDLARRVRDRLPDLARWGLLLTGGVLSDESGWAPGCKDFANLAQLLTWLLGQVDRDQAPEWTDILAARIGEPMVAPYQTLASLSQPRASAEWVRQIERRCVESLLERHAVQALITNVAECITSAMEKSRAPVPLGPDCPLSCLVTNEPAAAKRFIRLFFSSRYELPEFETGEDGLTVLAPGALAEFKPARQDLVQMVKQRVRVDQRLFSQLMPLLERDLKKHSPLTRGELERQFIAQLNWSREPPGATARLVSLGRAADAVIVAVMARAGTPLNRKEIVSACADEPFKLDLKPASVGNVLASLTADPLNSERDHVFEGVFQVGHGVYACQADLPVDIEELHTLVDQATKMIRNGRRSIWKDSPVGDAYQWHCADLVAELAGKPGFEELERADESQRWYLLDGALRYHRPADVVNLQKGFWMARREDLPEEEHRKLEQIEVVSYVLQAVGKGRPMQVAEIRDKVAQVQSLGAGGQLQVAASALEGSGIERVGHGLLTLKS